MNSFYGALMHKFGALLPAAPTLLDSSGNDLLFAPAMSGFSMFWRMKAKNRFTRIATAVGAAACAVFLGGCGGASTRTATSETAQQSAARPDKLWVPVVSAATITKGKKAFAADSCGLCHRMNGVGGVVGPDLTHEAQRHSEIAWQIAHLKNPKKMQPGSTMPAFAKLSADDLNALASYMATRK